MQNKYEVNLKRSYYLRDDYLKDNDVGKWLQVCNYIKKYNWNKFIQVYNIYIVKNV